MNNIGNDSYTCNPGSATNQRDTGAVDQSARAMLGHHSVGYNNPPQTHLPHAPSPEAETIFKFTDVVTGDTHIAKDFSELLSYDQLLLKLRDSGGEIYANHGQPVEQIAKDIRSNDYLKWLLLSVNNIEEIPVAREASLIADRDISTSGFDVEDSSGSDTDNAPERPFNEAMSNRTNRAQTFNNSNWRNVRRSSVFSSAVSNQDISASGFYSLKDGELVRCFSCGGCLQNWKVDETPDDLHAQKFPKCQFIRKKLGAELVNTIQEALTTEQKNAVARTIPGSRHLYSQPIGGQSNRQVAGSSDDLTRFPASSSSRTARSRARSRARSWARSWAETSRAERSRSRHRPDASSSSSSSSISGYRSDSSSGTSSPVSWLDQEHPAHYRTYNQPADINLSLNEAKARLVNIFSPVQIQKLHILEDKVKSANDSERLHLGDVYKEILNNLLKKPELIGEIIGIIESMSSRDCEDHTAEVCDLIKVRFKAATLTEGICDQDNSINWFSLLGKAKLLIHEEQLISVLGRHNLLGGNESTEIRAYVKNRFAREICEFSENHIQQYFPEQGRSVVNAIRGQYGRLQYDFIQAINNKSLLKNYLISLCKDEIFFAFIKSHDEELSQWLAKENSNFDGLVDHYDQNHAGSSSSNEYAYVTSLNRLRETKDLVDSVALNQFFESKIDEQWNALVYATQPSTY
ncbi:baculoviral IAP repeat-containing protein [Endozoicomonas sp. ALB115]|uniref:baculoviral IAP repeat-containing protein n=1 Tax=Endozoicomonas sp. ALB115 TaxID=3403074 RepID=UPI003BB7B015